jgi:hypothetical protein
LIKWLGVLFGCPLDWLPDGFNNKKTQQKSGDFAPLASALPPREFTKNDNLLSSPRRGNNPRKPMRLGFML